MGITTMFMFRATGANANAQRVTVLHNNHQNRKEKTSQSAMGLISYV